jgi:hypothetical protein
MFVFSRRSLALRRGMLGDERGMIGLAVAALA